MSNTYLDSNDSSIAGISDVGNLKGHAPSFQGAARRQANRAGRPLGDDLGRQMMQNLQIQAANWPEITPEKEELHYEAA